MPRRGARAGAALEAGPAHFAIIGYGPDCKGAGQDIFVAWSPLRTFLAAWVERYLACTRKR